MTTLTGTSDHMDATKRAYLELHIAVFLWGFTAILGDLIQLSALNLVWWRVLITSISLLFFVRPATVLWKLSRKSLLRFSLVGVLTALHWVTFYGSIKLANASIGLICLATCAFFTSLIEPFVMRQKVKWHEVMLGLLMIPGMALIVENVDVSMHQGIWVGLLSAFLVSLFSILNKKWIAAADPMSITFIEMTSAWLFLSLILPFYFLSESGAALLPSAKDFLLLIVLAVLCTTLTWVLALRSLKHISAFATTLTVNLEPVYGMFLAWILLSDNQELSPGFYWGVLMIMVIVLSYPFMNRLMNKYGLLKNDK